MEKKICSECKIEKEVCEFYKINGNKTRAKCKECFINETNTFSKSNREKRNKIQKVWREKNKEIVKEYRKKYYNDNPEKFKKISSEYRKKNPEKIKNQFREYYLKHKKNINSKNKTWREKNEVYKNEQKKIWNKNNREHIRKYNVEKYHNDILYNLKFKCRNRILQFLKTKNMIKNSKTYDILGCTPQELKEHLEKQFVEGMTWENRGEWHIDHIIPLSSAKDEDEVYRLCHFTNLQPLWALDNLKKSNKLIKN